jgi:hypothetical protein
MAAVKLGDYAEIVVHVGLRKTGTTFIQSTLRANRALLARHSIHYPEYRRPLLARNLDGNHSFAFGKLQDMQDLWAGLQERIDCSSDCRTLLLSAEGMSSLPGLRALLGALKTEAPGSRIRLVVYLRRYDHFYEATYAEAAKHVQIGSIDNYVGLRRFGDIMSLILADLGREGLVLRSYNQLKWDRGSLAHDFLAAIARPDLADEMEVEPGRRANPTLTRAQTYLLTRLPDRKAKIGLLDYFEEHPLPITRKDSRFFLSPTAREALNIAGLKDDAAAFKAAGINDPVEFLGIGPTTEAEVWTPFEPDLAVLEPYLAEFLVHHEAEQERHAEAQRDRIARKSSLLTKSGSFMEANSWKKSS